MVLSVGGFVRACVSGLEQAHVPAGVFLGQQVDDQIANSIAAQMLYLAGQDADKDIWLYINSPGGSVSAGLSIFTGSSV